MIPLPGTVVGSVTVEAEGSQDIDRGMVNLMAW